MKKPEILALISIVLIGLALGAVSTARAASPPIGMNAGPIDDWGPDLIFADAVKHARYWESTTGNNYNIGDANGWPTQDAQIGMWWSGLNMDGTYAMSFNGIAASISPSGGSITNQVYNSSTNTTTATFTMATYADLWITFTGTQRTSTSATNTGITNFKMMRPSTEGGSTPLSTSVTFTPAFETFMSQFSVVRYMDTSATNGNNTVNWSDRIPPTWYSQSASQSTFPGNGNGCAWEYIVQLSNEINKDAWINVPRFASNQYISNLAELIKYGSDGTNPYTSTQSNPVYKPLNSNLHCYVEYGNEIWNFSPSDLTALGNAELFSYPVTSNGLATSIVNSPLSSIADSDNGLSGPTNEIPGVGSTSNPNYFRDVVFNNSTTLLTTQTPAATATDTSGGDEFGMKFQSSTAGTITGVRFYKISGETGTHTGHLWKYGAPNGNQVAWLWSGGGDMSQSMTFPTTGTYTVSFYASGVTGDSSLPTIQVSVDGTNVGSAITPTFGFQQYTSAGFTISTTGAHTVMFTDTNANGRALIDLVTVSGPGSVTVANNSFESPSLKTLPTPMVTGGVGYEFYAGAGWTMGGNGAGITLSGVSGEWGDFNCFGTLLGTVTFSGETGSGWQQANFGTGVSIAANTTYMVSVNNNSTYGYTNSVQSGPLSWDGNMTLAYYRRWVERAVQVSNTFRSIWGDGSMPGTSANPTIRPVLMMVASGGWIGNYTYYDLEDYEDYFNNQLALSAMPDGSITTAHPITYNFWCGGGAPYYDPSGTYTESSVWTTGDWNTTSFTSDWLTGTADVYTPEWGRYISYEGGPELPDNGTLSAAIWNDSRMESLLTSHQTAYNQTGGDLWCYYDTTDGYRWGFTNDDYNLSTPKMVGVSQINASTESTGTYGTAIPSTIPANSSVGTAFMGGFGNSNLNNMAAGANHSDFVGYSVSVANASAFTIGVSAGSVGSSNQAYVYVDGVLAGAITMANTGSNTTYASSSTVTSQNLAVGTHGIMIKAVSGSFGLSAILVTGGTLTVPNPPTGLTATPGNTQVALSWSASSGAASYDVYRGTTAGGENGTPIATGIATTAYTNTGLTNGTTYYYKVTAVNAAGTSGYSNEASATPTAGVPAAPTGLSATAGNAQVSLSWTASSGATSYNVYRGTTAGGESGTAIATGIATTAYTNTGLTNGTTYYFTVKALNSSGTSGASNEASATPTSGGGGSAVVQINCGGSAAAPFVADTDFSGTADSTTTVTNTINTSAVTNPAPVAVYQSNRYAGPFTYTIPSLTSGNTYVVRLHFCETYYTSVGAREFNVTINGTQVLTNFDMVAAAGGPNIANVQQFNTTANGSGQIVIVFANGAVDHAQINGIEIDTPGSGSVPPAPTGLTATPGNSQVALSWTASSGATSYNVYRGTTAGGESGAPITSGVTTTNYTNTGLTNGTTYYYKVAAVNTSGTSGYSSEASATPQVSAPPAPTGLTATPGNAQVALSWTASSGATSYNVYRGTTSGGESGTAIATGVTSTSYTNMGLTNGTTYYFTVKALNAGGTSGASNEASATPTSGGGGTPVVQINCGGSAAAPFVADTDFSGTADSTTTVTNTINTSAVTNPAPVAVYQSNRYAGPFTYTIPSLTSGNTYVVRLHFCETYYTSVGAREFNVTINGTQVLTNFDMVAAAGGPNIANVQQFNTTANGSGQIVIVFANGAVDHAQINGIEIDTPGGGSAPPAPTGLAATGGNAQVSLTWTASSGATSYSVYRGTTAGGESATAIATGVTTTSYTDTGLTNGTTYYYEVKAVNTGGASGYSNESSATPSTGTVTVPNDSFETPSIGAGNYEYSPSGATWTFAGDSGFAANGSQFGNPNAPDGTQVAILQGNPNQSPGTLGAITVAVNFTATGSYKISFDAAQRSGQVQPIEVTLDGTQVGSNISPTSSTFAGYTSASFTISTTGNHTIGLAATDNTGDKTSFIDLVTIGH